MKHYLIGIVILLFSIILTPLLALSKEAPEPPAVNTGQPSVTTSAKPADSVKLLDSSTGQVLTVGVEDYLCGVILCELYPSYHTEAFKAQAVAAYTNIVRYKAQQEEKPSEELKGAYTSVDTENRLGYMTREQAQNHLGTSFESTWKKAQSAVEEVLNYVLTSEGKPIFAAYHSISTGKTEAAENVWGSASPCLTSVDSSWDALAKDYQSTVTFTTAQLKEKLLETYKDATFGTAENTWFQNPELTEAGNVKTVTAGSLSLTGPQARDALHLRSAAFTVTFDSGVFTFTVKGYGHDVGMSQNGADYMARQGKSWKEILQWYYPGANIEKLAK